jgi:vitamin B12 transport system substrate-binding protein
MLPGWRGCSGSYWAGRRPVILSPAPSRRLWTRHPRVLLLAWDQPPIVIGAGSFQSEILALAGGRNLFEDVPAPSATVSIEAIADRDPDLILVADTAVPAIARRPEWRVVAAVRERRFVHMPATAFSRPGLRAPELVRALRVALEAAHP